MEETWLEKETVVRQAGQPALLDGRQRSNRQMLIEQVQLIQELAQVRIFPGEGNHNQLVMVLQPILRHLQFTNR